MNKKLIYFLATLFIFNLLSCIEIDNQFTALPPGPWRAVLKIPKQLTPDALETIETEEYQAVRPYHEMPFNFEVKYASPDSFYLELINGEERIIANSIKYGIDRATAKDTLVINFPAYDTYIKGIFEEKFIEGAWHVNYKENYSIPFIAFQGQSKRFNVDPKDAEIDLNGEWDVNFEYNNPGEEYPAKGIFKQVGNHLTGTFKTETGDYRYLEGVVSGKKFYLSVFDGAHAFLFEGKQTSDNQLVGTFFSGKHYKCDWIGEKSTGKELTSPYQLSKATTEKPISFSFKNDKGEQVNLTDDQYQGKAKLINIMGTWCPNCRDEVNFLKENYSELKKQDIEVISIAFERYKLEEKSIAAIGRYKTHINLPWEILHGGYYNKKEAVNQVPFIDQVISYPTLLFVDQNNIIQKIHTGFNGPATKEFTSFKEEFWENVNNLKE